MGEMKTMSIRDFPVELRREMKAIAAISGKTLRDAFIDACKEYVKKHKK